MLFQGFCFAVFVTLQLATGIPLQDEKIKPVSLASRCAFLENEETKKSGVILIHGLGQSGDTWGKSLLTVSLETNREVCAVDLRNHGMSPWNDEEYDVKAMIADIEHYADSHSQNFQKVNLIGHSLGGKIAMNFALKYPDRVNSLVVEDMKPTNPSPEVVAVTIKWLKLMKEAIKNVPEGSDEDEARDVIVDYLSKKLKENGITDLPLDESSKKLIELRCDKKKCEYLTNIDTLIKAVENMDAFMGESKGLYKGPTMFIYGKKSVVNVDKDRSNILKLFPNAKLVGVEGAGHHIHGFNREFNDQVIRFLNGLEN